MKIYWTNSTFKIRYINYARRSANLMIQRKSSIECFENNINFIFCNWNFIHLFSSTLKILKYMNLTWKQLNERNTDVVVDICLYYRYSCQTSQLIIFLHFSDGF